MRQTFFLLAVLVVLNGCASRTQTTSRTTQTTDQMAQTSTALDRQGGIDSEWSGQGASALAQGAAVTGERGRATIAEQANLVLHREELVVGKREVSNGGVLLRTIVETNSVEQPVQLRREEYVIERVPADQIQQAEALPRATVEPFQEREIFIQLTREVPVATKRALAVEQVRLDRRVETEQVNVTRPIRAEEVVIEKVAAPPIAEGGVLQDGAMAAATGAPLDVPQNALILEREELTVGKREVEHGGVRLRKVVQTQEASQPVELRREEYAIDRIPLDNRIAERADFTPREIRATLMREEPVAGVRDFVTEVIRVRKVVETDSEVIAANLRQERLEVIENPEGGGTAMGTASGVDVTGATGMRETGGATRTEMESEQISGDDLAINEQVNSFLSQRTWTQNPPPWQVDETYLRKGIDVRPPRNTPTTQLPPPSDLGENIGLFEVTTQRGVVTLRGTVSSEAQKRYIGQQVSAIPGVRSVNNELEVVTRNAPASRGTGAETLNNGQF